MYRHCTFLVFILSKLCMLLVFNYDKHVQLNQIYCKNQFPDLTSIPTFLVTQRKLPSDF